MATPAPVVVTDVLKPIPPFPVTFATPFPVDATTTSVLPPNLAKATGFVVPGATDFGVPLGIKVLQVAGDWAKVQYSTGALQAVQAWVHVHRVFWVIP
jgi:hypothetical protein